MKTKIYGTIGPACCDTEMLVHLFEKGMTGIRINLSHADLEEADAWISGIHSAWSRLHDGTPEILIDLRGPELRIGTLGAERLLKEGDGLSLVADGQNNLFDPTEIPVPGTLLVALAPGQEILLDDGRIALKVEEQFRCGSSVAVECTVVRGGVLKSGKSIAAPGVEIQTPTLTERDYRNLARVKQCRITGVMLPFVRNQEDLKNLKEALINEDAGDIRIFAKIENLQGMEHLGELLPHCDEIVIAKEIWGMRCLWQSFRARRRRLRLSVESTGARLWLSRRCSPPWSIGRCRRGRKCPIYSVQCSRARHL